MTYIFSKSKTTAKPKLILGLAKLSKIVGIIFFLFFSHLFSFLPEGVGLGF
jgi:hypothetical protein